MIMAGIIGSRRFVLAVLALLAAAVLLLGPALCERGGENGSPSSFERRSAVWTCAMHPQIRLDKPGQCPICFMDLVEAATDDAAAAGGAATLELTPEAVALADIAVAPVERRFVERRVGLAGVVVVDQGRVRRLTAWFPGRIDSLDVVGTGAVVAAGDRLAVLYSPRLYAAQVELREALAAAGSAGTELMRRTARATAEAARERLLRWGLAPERIDALAAAERPTDRLPVLAPVGGVVLDKPAVEGMEVVAGQTLFEVADLRRVWIELDAYASDLPWLRVGQRVELKTDAIAEPIGSGVVALIDPVLDPVRRTAVVRIEADNPRGLLRPGLLVKGTVAAALDAGGVPADADGEPPLVIPATAPLLTGKRAVVYVRDPDAATPRFSGREVLLGPRAGDHYLVASGLREGEQVVVEGAFKIDSEMQIRARPSMMTAAGAESPDTVRGHGHHPAADAEAPAAVSSAAGPFPVGVEFRAGLDRVVASYLGLQTALAADDPVGASDAAGALAAALAAVDAAGLAASAAAAWSDDREHLAGAAAGIAAGGALDYMRLPLDVLSDRLWRTLLRFDYRGDETIRRFHCPMAGEGGADWLQRELLTANPYYGSAMLRCGSQTDTIPAIAGGGR